MIRNHAQVIVKQMMSWKKAIQISIRVFLCFGIFHAMDDARSFHADHSDLAGQIRVLRLLREEQKNSSASRREWGKILEQRFEQAFGRVDLKDAERKLLCISGEPFAGPAIKQMELLPSNPSAFKPYQKKSKETDPEPKS